MFRCRMTPARVARLVPLFAIAFVSEAVSQQNPTQTAPETPAGAATKGATPPNAVPLPPVVVEAQRPRRAPARRSAPQRRVARSTNPPAAARPPATTAPAASPSPGEGIYATPAPVKERYQLPTTTKSLTAKKIEQTVNAVDTEDAIKYLPSLFVRKRNYGDNQSVLATRTWGLNSSARSLIYADDILLSTLIGNNNGTASPHWGLISPEEIQRIDFLYGPFAAMYPGNSIGGVLLMTTKMPDKFEASVKQTEAFQTFNTYNTKNTYATNQTSATIGNRWNDLSVFVSANYQDSHSQPLAWITTAGTPAGTTGTIPQLSRTGTVANVLGAGGLLHTEMLNLKGKAALDITPWLQATYVVGLFSNDQNSNVQSYLRDANGNPTFGGSGTVGGAAFASNYYNLNQIDLANALTLKTDTKGALDAEIVVSRFDYLKDIQRNPFTVATSGLGFTNTGRITRLDGTNWTTADAKGIWRTPGPVGEHEISFGVHGDQYELVNPVYSTPTWNSGPGCHLASLLHWQRQNADDRPVDSGCLALRAALEADARRALGRLARLRWLQSDHRDQFDDRCDHLDQQPGPANHWRRTHLAESGFEFRSQQGLGRDLFIRRSQSLPDCRRALSDDHGRNDLGQSQSQPAAGTGAR